MLLDLGIKSTEVFLFLVFLGKKCVLCTLLGRKRGGERRFLLIRERFICQETRSNTILFHLRHSGLLLLLLLLPCYVSLPPCQGAAVLTSTDHPVAVLNRSMTKWRTTELTQNSPLNTMTGVRPNKHNRTTVHLFGRELLQPLDLICSMPWAVANYTIVTGSKHCLNEWQTSWDQLHSKIKAHSTEKGSSLFCLDFGLMVRKRLKWKLSLW